MMNSGKKFSEERQQDILNAAASLIMHYGYDKTTMSDIATEAGLTRAIVYLHFDNKDSLFEALLHRETLKYMEAWLQAIENDPHGGSLAGVFRSVLSALNSSPFMSALMKQDQRFFGRYVRKPGNLYQPLQSGAIWSQTLLELQAAGAIRQDIKAHVVASIMHALALGLISMEDDKDIVDQPSFTEILETVADMLERLLLPADGGNLEAGKAIIRRIAAAAKDQMKQVKLPG